MLRPLIIDTDAKTHGLSITGNKIIVVGEREIVTWALPERDSVFTTKRQDINHSVKTTTLEDFASITSFGTSISPNLNYVAIGGSHNLCIYDINTGKKLADERSNGVFFTFTPCGNEIWCAGNNGTMEKWEIVEQNGSTAFHLKELESDIHILKGFPWHSPHGHQITDDGWILSSSGKWLLWLPPHWRPDVCQGHSTLRSHVLDGVLRLAILNRNFPVGCS